jgi:hypothetical protein
MLRKMAIVAAVVGGVVVAGQARQAQSPGLADLKTTAEASDYKSTSTHEDVVKFMQAVDAASPLIHYTTYGTTHEGRAMPLAVVGTGLKDSSAAAVLAAGKLRVHIQGNIHAGEVEGKEAAQILLREIAMGQHAGLLESMVLLVTPIFNADGNERMSPTNRGSQHGPINGMGTRANAQSININRDFMKLESPEARAFVTLWNDYDPHVGFDLHTSNGSQHAYHLTYSPPLHPNTSDAIMSLMKNEWFPFVTKTIKAEHGWETFYYGNARGGRGGGRGGRGRGGDAAAAGRGAAGRGAAGRAGDPPAQTGAPEMRAWGTFEHVPRFHNNYVGLRNRFALLSEAYSYATFEDRINATRYFVDAALRFAHANVDRLKQITAAADKASIVGTTQATRAAMRRGDPIEILMGEVEQETNPVSGRQMNRRLDVVRPEKMIDMLWFEPTMTEEVAAEYYVPAEAKAALDLLRLHGIEMRQVTAPVTGVERFTIASNTTSAVRKGSIADFGSHALRRLEGSWQAAPDARVPAGAWAVPMNQPRARLAFYLLAPTSDDGVVNWNVIDDLLTDGAPYPIVRKQ